MSSALKSKILVTLSGECFGVEFQGVGPANDCDGELHYFKLHDLLKDRGTRSVSLFQPGTGKASTVTPNYDSDIEGVRLNVLRRAFDSGLFSFETTIPPNRYHELPLRGEDFQPQKKVSDEGIQRFIKLGAYFLGFKHSVDAKMPFVDFNCAEDFEYLGAKMPDVARNLRLLIEEGYLRRPPILTGLEAYPTAKLIRELQNGDAMAKKRFSIGAKVWIKTPGIGGEIIHTDDAPTVMGEYWHTIKTEHGERKEPGCNLDLVPTPLGNSERPGVTQNVHIYGPNARFNQNSTDNSTNVASVSGNRVFTQIREATSSVASESERKEILSKLEALQEAHGSAGYLGAYQNFVACVANHMTIFGPFIPMLTQMLSNK